MVLRKNHRNKNDRLHDKQNLEQDWEAAEQRVAKILTALLLDGCLVFNDIKFKYGNIDHLVIRPDGVVFLVDTKSQRGRVTTDGKQLLLNGRPFKKNYLSQINCNIRWLRALAKKIFGGNRWYVAVIVFPNAEVQIHRSVKRVNALNSKDILGFIRAYRH